MIQGSFGSFLVFVRRHWQLLLGLALGVLLPLVFVADLTEDIFRDGGFPWDQGLLEWYRAHRTPGLTALARAMAEIGGVRILPVLTLALALLLALRHRRPQGMFLVSSVLGATLLNVAAKAAFQRARPDTLGAVLTEPGFSFPSGHAMANTAFAAALVLIFWPTRWRWPVTVAALLWAVGICASRNYLGVHYPTDVLVGFLSSVAWVAGLYSVMSRRWPSLRRAQGVDTLPARVR